MSEIPDEQKVIKSIMISGALMLVFLTLVMSLWAGLFDSFVNSIQTYLYIFHDLLAILLLFVFYIFLFITVATIREYMRKVRSGWTEVISTLIFIFIMGIALFNFGVAVATLLLSILFIIYLHMIQE